MNALLHSFQRIVALTWKELLAILKDPRSLVTLIGPPIIQCVVFGYAASYDLNNIPYAICDRSGGAQARALVARFDGTGIFHRVATVTDEADFRELVNEEKAALVLSIGPDFDREINAGRPAKVQIITDGRNSNTAGTAAAYANRIIEDFNASLRENAGSTAPALKITGRAWYNPNFETQWSIVPALIGTLTLLQTLLLASMAVAREREQGTFDQLLVTPFRPAEIMCGKTLPTILIGIVQATNIILVAEFWFHIPFSGSYGLLYLGIIVFLFSAVGIGLFISALSGTMQQAMLYTFSTLAPFILLSGFTTPIENMPGWVQWLTYLNPLRYCVDIVRRIYLEGAGFVQIAPELTAMGALAAVTLAGSSWLFRRKLY